MLTGRHRHKIGYECWRYMKGNGRCKMFGGAILSHTTKYRHRSIRNLFAWFKYCSKYRNWSDKDNYSDYLFFKK